MNENTQPTLGNGKICYLSCLHGMPRESGLFYQSVFGWNIRTRGDGSNAFDDGVGQVSGTGEQTGNHQQKSNAGAYHGG
jgi:hypothetical protein